MSTERDEQIAEALRRLAAQLANIADFLSKPPPQPDEGRT